MGIAAFRDVGIGVVAEHALATHPPQEAEVVGAVEARRHAPALILGVPGDGKLVELPPGGAEEIGARGVAGAQDPVDLLLDDVDRLAVGGELVALHHQAAVAADHLVVPARR